MTIEDRLQPFARTPRYIDTECLTLFHVARLFEFPILPYDVHVYLAGLAAWVNDPARNSVHPQYVVRTRDELKQVVNDFATSPLKNSRAYFVGKSTGDFYMNFGPMQASGFISYSDDASLFSSFKPEEKVGLMGESYFVAATFGRRMFRHGEAPVFKVFADNAKPFFDLMVAYYTFMSRNPEFVPGEEHIRKFNMVYSTAQMRLALNVVKSPRPN